MLIECILRLLRNHRGMTYLYHWQVVRQMPLIHQISQLPPLDPMEFVILDIKRGYF